MKKRTILKVMYVVLKVPSLYIIIPTGRKSKYGYRDQTVTANMFLKLYLNLIKIVIKDNIKVTDKINIKQKIIKIIIDNIGFVK